MTDDIWFENVSAKDSLKLVSWWNWSTIDTFRREFAYTRNGKKYYTILRTKFICHHEVVKNHI